jgi:ABC-type Na+ transport system ATPase subunit NatA
MINKKTGKVIAIVGMTGTGKSTEVKHIINSTPNHKHYIFDVQGEYERNFYTGRMDDENDFLDFVEQVTDSVIVFEEATSFLSYGQNKRVRRMMVNRRHSNNLIVLVFHAVHLTPKQIRTLIDVLILKPTGDKYKEIEDFVQHSPTGISQLQNLQRHRKNNIHHTEYIKMI